jgi:prepilin-type processing-associated H-X9-DG protein
VTIDLTGGIDLEREYVFAERPDNPEMRDSVSFWVSDDHGGLGLPRVGIEAMAEHWEAHGLQVNLAFADGRAYRARQEWPAKGPDGLPTVLGAGPLNFRCVEPFRTWTMSFDGSLVQTSTFDLMEGKKDGPQVEVRFEVEATLAAPPWIQGSLLAEARALGGLARCRVLRRGRPHGFSPGHISDSILTPMWRSSGVRRRGGHAGAAV